MKIKEALANPTIVRAMRDMKARRMVGTYAGRQEIAAAEWLLPNGFGRYV